MASLVTQLQAFYLSSDIPDLRWSATGDELRVRVLYQPTGDLLLESSLTVRGGFVRIYETRDLIERYMRLNAIARLYPLQIEHMENGSWHNDASMMVIFCEKKISMGTNSSVSAWLQENFLSTLKAKVLPTEESTVEQLFFVQPQGTPPNPSLHVTYINSSDAVVTRDISLVANYGASLTNLFVVEFSVDSIKVAIPAAVNVIGVTVSVGSRHMEYYRPARRENVAFRFRNAFNVMESAYLSAAVSRKTEDGRKIAHVTGNLAHYDRKPVTEYEVQTAPLSFEEASWIDQLITSPDVRLLDDTQLIITQGEAVCNNDNAELNSAKFSYKELDEKHSIAASEKVNVFTVPPHSYQFA